MTPSTTLDDLRERLERAGTAAEVRSLFADLDRAAQGWPSSASSRELVEGAFRLLREFTANDAERAVAVLLDDLLPRCLRPDPPGDGDQEPRLDVAFGEWLQILPEAPRLQVRRVALARAVEASHGRAIRNALRVISAVGYGDPAVLQRLDDICADRLDEVGDHALSTRVWLRPYPLPRLRRELHRRIPRSRTLSLLVASRVIGNRDTVELVCEHWLSSAGRAEGTRRDFHFDLTLTLLVDIALRNPTSLPDRVWHHLTTLLGNPSAPGSHTWALAGNIAPRLPARGVIPEMVRWASQCNGHARYVHYLRLTECVLPAHLRSWDGVPLSDLGKVREDALRPTGVSGRVATAEVGQKEKAWEVLLSRGDPGEAHLLGRAIEAEKSPYIQHLFLELAGCVGVAPLPPIVARLVAPGGDHTGQPDDARLIAQIGAIRAAHGAADQTAFDALMVYRPLGGGVLLSATRGLAEAAVTLPQGRNARIHRLLAAAESSPDPNTRATAAGAAAVLVETGRIPKRELGRAAGLAARSTTDHYARRELLLAFATAGEPPPDDLVDYATHLLEAGPRDDSEELYGPALSLVARAKGRAADANFLSSRLGLVARGGRVDIGLGPVDRAVAHVVGLYYASAPERFAPAIASLLRTGDATVLAAVVPSVSSVRPAPSAVVEALAFRVRRMDGGNLTEPPVLHALAAVAPGHLLTGACAGVDSWLPQARADLADAVGRVGPLTGELSQARFDLLVRLAGDGVYAVRRASYRAAVRCDAGGFGSLIVSWASAREARGARLGAAEAIGWLPRRAMQGVLTALAWDPEPEVRKAFQRSVAERDERRLADRYVARVCTVRRPESVVRRWRYGLALSRLGDDAALDKLDARLADPLHPAVRQWLERVRKAVQRRWDENTRKWPDPWFTRRGHLEQFAGGIHVRGERGVRVSGTLWQMPGGLGGVSSWGGWGTSRRLSSEAGELRIPGRRPAEILITSTQFPEGAVIFAGNGPYPDHM